MKQKYLIYNDNFENTGDLDEIAEIVATKLQKNATRFKQRQSQ